MLNLRSYLTENSLYTSKSEYDALVADEARAAKVFLTSFVGTVVLFSVDPTRPILANYLRTEGPVRLNSMTDTNNDVSLAIKIAVEAGVIRQHMARNLTRFVYLLKTRKIKTIDWDALRPMIATPLMLRSLKGRYKTEFTQYYNGAISAQQMLYNLRNVMRTDDEVGTEFMDIFVKYRSALKKAVGATDTDADDDTSDDTVAVVTSPAASDVVSDTPAADSLPPTTATDAENKSDAVEISADAPTVKVSAPTQPVAPDYDLTNPAAVKDHFIKMMQSGDAKVYLKSISSGITKFPWQLLNIDDPEVCVAFYQNQRALSPHTYLAKGSSTRGTRKKYIPADMSLIAIGELTSDSDYMIEEFTEAYGLIYNERPNTITLIDHIFNKSAKITKSLDSAVSFYRAVVETLDHYDAPDILLSFVSSHYNKPLASYVQDNPNILSEVSPENRLTLHKVIITELVGSFLNATKARISKMVADYMGKKHSKKLLKETFKHAAFEPYYDYLESVNFFDDPQLLEFKVAEIDLSTDEKVNYEHLKKIEPKNLTDEEKDFLMTYIDTHDLYSDYVISNELYEYDLDNFSNLDRINGYLVSFDRSLNPSTRKEFINRIGFELIFNSFIKADISSWWEDARMLSVRLGGIKSIAENNAIQSQLIPAFEKYAEANGLKDKVVTFNIEQLNKMSSFGITDLITKVSYFTKIELADTVDQIIGNSTQEQQLLSIILNRGRRDGGNNTINQVLRLPMDVHGIIELRSELLNKIVDGMSKEFIETEISKHISNYMPPESDMISLLFTVLSDREKANVFVKSSINFDAHYVRASDVLLVKQMYDADPADLLETLKNSKNTLIFFTNDLGLSEEVVSEIINAQYDRLTEPAEKEEYVKSLFSSFLSRKDSDAFKSRLLTLLNNDPETVKDVVTKMLVTFQGSTGTLFHMFDLVVNVDDPDLSEIAVQGMTKFFEDAGATAEARNAIKFYHEEILSVALQSQSYGARIIDSVKSPTYKRKLLESITTKLVIENSNIRGEIYNDATGIVPLFDMNDMRLTKILEYNNIKFDQISTRRKRNESTEDYIGRISSEVKTTSFQIGPVNAISDELTEEQAKRASVEYAAYNSGNHGDTALEFINSFTVGENITNEAYHTFKTEHPSTVLHPVFHGTGSVAASMILRFGYSIIDSSDSSAVGRMLGNGIYFSNVIDKSAQYIGDGGYARRKGMVGYIFEMEAVTGIEGIHHSAAGISGRDGIRSPEWCVFDPALQLSIKKAHKVKMVSNSRINELRTELLGEAVTPAYATPIRTLREWIKTERLNENQPQQNFKYVATFIFTDNMIPLGDGVSVNPKTQSETVFADRDDVWLETNAKGIAVCIGYNDPEAFDNDVYFVNSGADWMQSDDPVYEAYLTALKGN